MCVAIATDFIYYLGHMTENVPKTIWVEPNASILTFIEQIETAFKDTSLSEEERVEICQELWLRMEEMYGGRIHTLIPPENDEKFKRPFD